MKEWSEQHKEKWIDFAYIVIGSLFPALSFQAFLLPNNIAAGGVSGISTVFVEWFNWNPSLVQLAINIPLLVLCFAMLGKAAGYKTILGSLLVPIFVGLFQFIQPATDNLLLAAIFGGLLTGIGVGIVFRAKASTGGTSIVAQILHEYGNLPLGLSSGIVDAFVILLAFFTFDSDTVLFSLISLFIMSRTVDIAQVGLNRVKNVLIISNQPEEIKGEILHTLNRGVTNLGIKGGYGGKDSDMLMCVVSEREFTVLKDTILSADPGAFVIAMPASEVLGRGFTLQKEFGLPTSQVKEELKDRY